MTIQLGPIFVAILAALAVGCQWELGDRRNPNYRAIATAVEDGRVRFELRGLTTSSERQSSGATSFTHKGTVVALGDTVLTRIPFIVIYAAGE